MRQRDLDLDFVKGFLVLVMVLYHAMNHFAEVPPEYYGYLRFVNGSFVFISGYVVAAFHAGTSGQQNVQAARQLAWRGFKLLGLFTVLNLAASAAGITNYRNVTFGVSGYVSSLAGIYGRGDAQQIAFRILVPIAYLLIVSGVYLIAERARPWLIAATFLVALVYSPAGSMVPNLFFVLIGLVGLSFGLLRPCAPRIRIQSRLFITAAFIALASAMNALSSNVMTYAVGIAILLKLVYDGAGLTPETGRIHAALVLLGRYSLVCYIAQIGFLNLLHRASRGHDLSLGHELPLTVLATASLLLASCAWLDKLRHDFKVIEKTYRLVFA